MKDLLDILGSEERPDIKEFKVKKNKNIENILSFFEETVRQDKCYHYREWDDAIKKSNLKYLASDLSCLSIFMQPLFERYDHYFGFFLSSLINNCKDDEISMNVSNYPINFLATQNTKDLTVIGNVGENFCMSMISGNVKLIGNAYDSLGSGLADGEIIVDGNVGMYCADYMKNGKIIVNGNCGSCVGSTLRGGIVVVNGNVYSQLGYKMYNGKVIVEGNAGDVVGEEMHGGSILVKGNVGDETGKNMWSGEITILGDTGYEVGIGMCGNNDSKICLGGEFKSISGLKNEQWSCWKGEIYHKNKLIFKDGKPTNPNYLDYYKKYEWYTLKK